MVVNNFSPSTINGYTAAILRLYNHYKILPEKITEDQLVAFVCYLKEDLQRSASTMRIAVSAIKYFYKNILKKHALVDKIPYPKKEKYIRTILTGKQIKALFDNTENIKHRLMLKLAYSAGLRRSELIRVTQDDFDWKNNRLIIRQGKGKKDRYSILAKSLKPDFDRYIKTHCPKGALFYGRNKTKPISENSTRWIVDQAVARISFSKPGVCLHSLRHSFATHLLALNVDIVTIQQLMGHDDIRTTMEYFHLWNRPNSAPQSPLDTIYPAH